MDDEKRSSDEPPRADERPGPRDPAPRIPSSPAPPMTAVPASAPTPDARDSESGSEPATADRPGRDAPGGAAPGGDAPGGEALEGDAPGGDAPGGDRPEDEARDDDPAPSDRVTEELPRGEVTEADAPTLEIEPAVLSREADTLRRPEVAAEAADVAKKPKRARSVGLWIRRIAVVLLALGAAFAIVLYAAFDSIARWYVTFEAAQRGITIDAREMEVEWGRAAFWGATIQLDGAPSLSLHAEWLEVEALGFHPTSAKMRGVEIEARDVDAVRQGLAFGRTHGSDLVPISITDVHAVLGRAPGVAPTLEGRIPEVIFDPDAALLARRAVVTVARPKLTIGPVDVVAHASGAQVKLGLGDDLEHSPIAVDADLDSRQLAIDLPATPAATIAGWMGRKQVPNAPPWPGAFSIKTKVTGTWSADARSDLVGHVDATLIGIVPPHPPELNGIATGRDTVTSFDFRIGPRDEGISLDKLHVVVGRLTLDGTGRVVPREPSFVATATLRGSIPCQELVGTVAVSQLGLALGSTLGSLVRQNVAGNVDVTVGIRVDGEHVATPEVHPSAAIGCRLRLL